MSDIDPSEYSEDMDVCITEEDGSDVFDHASTEPMVAISDNSGHDDGVGMLDRVRAGVEVASEAKAWDGDLDIAAALLDLSRKVRITSTVTKAHAIPSPPISIPASAEPQPSESPEPAKTISDCASLTCEVERDIVGPSPATETRPLHDGHDLASCLSNLHGDDTEHKVRYLTQCLRSPT